MAGWCRVMITIAGVVLTFTIAGPSVARMQSFDIDRRLDRLEDIRSDARLTAIETRLNGIETVGTGILIAVGTQLILSGFSLRKSK